MLSLSFNSLIILQWCRNISVYFALIQETWTLVETKKSAKLLNVPPVLTQVYICGGFNGNECLQTCEYYSPETNQWTMITPMDNRRSGIGIIAHADHVYAVST